MNTGGPYTDNHKITLYNITMYTDTKEIWLNSIIKMTLTFTADLDRKKNL